MIWFSLLIPLAAIVFLSIKFPKKMAVVEYILLFVIPLICIAIGKWTSIHSQTTDTEFWNTYGKRAIYHERWDERVSCRHPIYESRTTSNPDGTTSTTSVYVGDEHSYDVDFHRPTWWLTDNMGARFSISKSTFEMLCTRWGNRNFKNLNRSYHSIDGDEYNSIYDNVFEHTVPLCKQHTYENKIQCSKSIFNFQEVDAETRTQYATFNYPGENIFGFNPILGHANKEASKKLSFANAHNGSRRQIHMMLLVFNGQPLDAGLWQEAYWKGGNKNEFIVCVGVNDKQIQWTKVISWTDQETLKVTVSREIKEMKEFDCNKVVDYMCDTIPKKFIRKEFADFAYLRVQPTTKAILITFIITVLVTTGISVFSVMNDFNLGDMFRRNRRRSYGRYR